MPLKHKKTSICLGLMPTQDLSGITIKAHDKVLGTDVTVAVTETAYATQDFTTFTKVDPNNHIQATANHITHQSWDDETAYLCKDMGTDYFGDFTHKIDVQSDFAQANSVGVFWMLSNDLGDPETLKFAGLSLIDLAMDKNGGLMLREAYGGGYYNDAWLGVLPNTPYYLLVTKSGTNLTAYVYDTAAHRDAAGSNGLLTTLNLTLNVDYKFRYIYGCNTNNRPVPHHAYLNNNISNLATQTTVVFNTPHAFTFQAGKSYTVPSTDSSGAPFDSWSTGETSTTITPTIAGTYTAIYATITCPPAGVEQFTNGGFETGNFTGWTVTQGAGFGIVVQKQNDYWSFIPAEEGTYYCGSQTNGSSGTIRQTFAKPIPCGCFTASSTFAVYAYGGWTGGCPGSGGNVSIDIVYDDATKTTVNWSNTSAQQNTWQKIDLKPYLVAGKKVAGVTIRINIGGSVYTMVDGCSCKI